jgi:hypothetical protein
MIPPINDENESNVDDNECVVAYSKCYYSGDSLRVCDDLMDLK